MNDNLDEYDFIPSSSSNLASLFESSGNLESSSLIYTAPKQPKTVVHTEIKSETVKPESSVICTCIVQVWKLTDNKYIAIGKHGLAIIGSAVQNTYELILYREKRNVIVRVKICNTFEISLKKDDFASFYDSLAENWLIKFGNADDSKKLLELITKFGGKVSTVVEKTEDTLLNEKQPYKPTELIPQNVKQPTLKPTEDILDNVDKFENKAKADILSRIAKMGQSILPNQNLESDVNELEEKNDKSVISSKETPIQNCVMSPSATVANIVQLPLHSQNIPNSVFMSQAMTYDPLNIYIAENRSHNSEVRMNLSQISEKLNHVLKLVDSNKPVTENNDALKSKIKVLYLKIENLSTEIKTYQEENTKLKLEIAQHQETLVTEKQRQIEQERIQNEQFSKTANFEREIDTYKSTINNLSEKVDEQKSELDALKLQLESYVNDPKMNDKIAELNGVISDLKTKLKNYEERETTTKLREQEDQEKISNFNSSLKELMNGMFSNIIENFNEDKDYKPSEISSIIAQNIKSTTMKIIHTFQQTSDV